ncbi:RNA-binding protein 25-like [Trifolium medium]|uniref:RNA-binding protein 25-like n=2 Tax=Trifolium medium TaxID=97028 RepID=A0A392MV70_9FABA|nr:RNA-binding protein 25-like [Trifolium medium]
MDEKFIIVSGKDRLVLSKGVDAVHKIREEGEQKGSSSSHMNRSRSPPPQRSPVNARFQRSEPQRSHSAPRNTPQFPQRFGRQERAVDDRVREDTQKFARDSPQGRNNVGYLYAIITKLCLHFNVVALTCHLLAARAYGNSAPRGRSSQSRSPRQAPHSGNSYNSFDGRSHNMSTYKNDGWDSHRRESGIQPGQQFDHNALPQSLEELELEYKKEAMELMKIRDREEDEENFQHREVRSLENNFCACRAIIYNHLFSHMVYH